MIAAVDGATRPTRAACTRTPVGRPRWGRRNHNSTKRCVVFRLRRSRSDTPYRPREWAAVFIRRLGVIGHRTKKALFLIPYSLFPIAQ